MDSGTLALWCLGVLWVLFALWVWNSQRFMENASKIHGLLHEMHRTDADMVKTLKQRQDAQHVLYDRQLRAMEQRIAGVEALLVSTVGQETEDFCRAMDGIMDRMEKPAPAPKVTLSEEHVGRFAKKGKGRG